MRRVGVTKLVLVCGLLPFIGGCELLRLNAGRGFSCDEVVRTPYRTQLTPRGEHLQMRFFNSARKSVCDLTVLAPRAEGETAVFPMIVIKTSVFSCRGDWQQMKADIG